MSENRVLYAVLSDSGSSGKYAIIQRVVIGPKRAILDAEKAVSNKWPTAKFEFWCADYRVCFVGNSDVAV